MSKKSNENLVGLIAFVSMCITAGLFLLAKLDLDLGEVGSLLSQVSLICAYIALAFTAYFFVCNKKLVWQVIYWIIVVLFIVTNFL